MENTEHGMNSSSDTPKPYLNDPTVKALKSSKEKLVQRVEGLKKDLADWRVRLNSQVEQCQTEMGGLRTQLMTEMEALRSEFLDMRTSLQKQMDASWTAVDKTDQPLQEKHKPVEA